MKVYETADTIPGRKILLATAADWVELSRNPSISKESAKLMEETATGLAPSYSLRITFLPEEADKIIAAAVARSASPEPAPTQQTFISPTGRISTVPTRD